jgi:hydroxymethylglutaryl-CoA lyase
MSDLEQMIPTVRDAGLHCEAVIAVSFGCPYEGPVPRARVLELAARIAAAGATEIVLAAFDAGIDSFESSFGELGGCPVPPGSTGNVATEDVVSMFHEMGVATGIDLHALLEATRDVRDVLGRPLGSHVLVAGPVRWDGIDAAV